MIITIHIFRKSLDLSKNQLNSIDNEAFSKLKQLKLLDLSNNLLSNVIFELPNSLEDFSLKENKLIDWPVIKMPENLEVLQIQHNKLSEIFRDETVFPNLKILNISGNSVGIFHNIFYPE